MSSLGLFRSLLWNLLEFLKFGGQSQTMPAVGRASALPTQRHINNSQKGGITMAKFIIKVVAQEREDPDLRRLARALIDLAIAQSEQQQHHADTDVDAAEDRPRAA